jgi:uncharacterized protein (DUF2147 family)
MRNNLSKNLLSAVFGLTLVAASAFAFAQSAASPIGRWKTLDDETGKAMTVVEVYTAKNGHLAARIVENIAAPANCEKCSGKDKGKPIVGMPVLWDLKAKPDGTWGDGQGFKPSAGMNFKAKSVKLLEGGKKLQVTGCKAVFLCRDATWVRD